MKEYSNGEITIVWKPDVCMHSGVCTRTLPEVYDPKGKPWIKIDNATTEELKAQVKKCPSGALTYYMNDGSEDQRVEDDVDEVEIKVSKNGPLLMHGKLKIKKSDGSVEYHHGNTALCRCGNSNNKPFCDGTHNKIGFKD